MQMNITDNICVKETRPQCTLYNTTQYGVQEQLKLTCGEGNQKNVCLGEVGSNGRGKREIYGVMVKVKILRRVLVTCMCTFPKTRTVILRVMLFNM